MNRLSFEDRASLSRKSEEFAKIAEELTNSYEKRKDFMYSNPYITHTSEICLGALACIALFAMAIDVIAWFIMGCWEETMPCFAYSTVDTMTYRNIV